MAKKKPSKKPADVNQSRGTTKTLTADEPRRVRPGSYTSFRLEKRLKTYKAPVRGSFRILFGAIKLLVKNWKLFGGILLIYLVLELVFVQGLSLITSGNSLQTTKHILNGASSLSSTTGSLFLLLIGNGTGNTSSSAYQFILLILVSLVLIWAIRQHFLGAEVRIRDAFYKGMAPLVPFFLVFLTIGVECIPGTVGVILYSAVATNGIAPTFIEKVLWGGITSILLIVSAYYVSATIFALYIVTLNDMTPVKAIRLASRLVRGRRLIVMTKVLFMPLAIFAILAIFMVPFLLFAVKIAPTAFFVITSATLAILHAYMYGLYRELLNE